MYEEIKLSPALEKINSLPWNNEQLKSVAEFMVCNFEAIKQAANTLNKPIEELSHDEIIEIIKQHDNTAFLMNQTSEKNTLQVNAMTANENKNIWQKIYDDAVIYGKKLHEKELEASRTITDTSPTPLKVTAKKKRKKKNLNLESDRDSQKPD
ncbi:hypothetical protein HUN01_28580 [Nostoc edaphicum CCNP1411]|uniref:Uncharacterized protein n=1 Tax=Nostoc edaphicum CCNP1411 TaxID=1472755 RepID=A0A7D7QM65_9NOSO|nr:hypothetical protein [Nostoc edaphicum]QMS91361.1 hypothetical protein HUN01_28580 [Nostoc edaphicum CCNP1411]